MHIDARSVGRSGKAVTNFDRTLPPAESDLAVESLKDPYKLDFLSVGDEAQERAIEQALVDHVAQFLVELGELKATAFRPEHVGQLGFYMAAVDGEIKTDADGPTIGLLLCKTKDEVVAEYALRNFDAPLG